jgi:hypothetical protein
MPIHSGFREVPFGLIKGELIGCHGVGTTALAGRVFHPDWAAPCLPTRRPARLGTSGEDTRFRPEDPNMHHCAFCKNPLHPLTEWKGNDGQFYCSEFCADAGDTLETSILSKAGASTAEPSKDYTSKKGMPD